MKIDPSKYCSIKTCAAEAGVSRMTIREAVKSGRLQGVQIDGYFFALKSACRRFKLDPVRTGRPRIHPADGTR